VHPAASFRKKDFFGSLFAKFPCSGQQEFARFKMPFCLRLLPPEPQICAAIICLKCLISAAGPRGAPARREVRWPDHFLTTRYFFHCYGATEKHFGNGGIPPLWAQGLWKLPLQLTLGSECHLGWRTSPWFCELQAQGTPKIFYPLVGVNPRFIFARFSVLPHRSPRSMQIAYPRLRRVRIAANSVGVR